MSNRSALTKCRRINGAALFEFTLVLPFALALTVAATDVYRVFTAYTALRSGVNEALRCTTPTAGKCSNEISDTAPRTYDWYEIHRQASQYLVSTLDFSGLATWLRKPQVRYLSPRATVLSSASYETAGFGYAAKRWAHDASGTTTVYVQRAVAPYLMRSDDPKLPNFRYKNSINTSYAGPRHSFRITNVRINSGSSTTNNASRTISVPLPSPQQSAVDARCFRSSDIDRPHRSDATPQFSTSCSIAEMSQAVPIVLHVKGLSHSNGTACKVSLKLTGSGVAGVESFDTGSNHWNKNNDGDLEGRLFSGSNSGNFVPRGAPANYVDETLLASDYVEFTKYRIKLKSSRIDGNGINLAQVKLNFSVMRADNVASSDCAWDGLSVDIYTPEFEVAQVQDRCTEQISHRDYLDGQSHCELANSQIPTDLHLAQIYVDPRNADTSAEILLSTQNSGVSPQTLLMQQTGVPESELLNYVLREISTGTGRMTMECPANSGVRAIKGSPEFSQQAAAACSTPNNASATWEEREILLNDAQLPTWDRTTCDAAAPDYESILSDYPKHVLGTPTIEYVPLYLGTAIDPATALANDNRFNCGIFSLETARYDCPNDNASNTNLATLEPGSLFCGEQDDLGSCAENILRDTAEHDNHSPLAPDAYFETSLRPIGTDIRLTPPENSCTPYRVQEGQELSRTLVGRNLITGNTPIRCQESGVSCVSVPSGFAMHSSADAPRLDLQLAASKAAEAILAAYPHATRSESENCAFSDCLFVRAESNEDTQQVQAHATLRVPLSVLFGRQLTVSHSQRADREIKFTQ